MPKTQNQSNIPKQFFALAIPNILSNLTVPLAGLLDTAFLGHLDSVLPLAAVALASMIFDYLYWSFGFLRMGTTGLIAEAFGAKNQQEQLNILIRGLTFAVIVALIFSIAQNLIIDFGFSILNGGTELKNEASKYFFARIWGAIPALSLYVLLGFFLGRQESKYFLIVASLLNGLNAILDYFFIVKFSWGSAGAAYATMISEWVALIIAIYLMKRSLNKESYKLKSMPLNINWQEIFNHKQILKMLSLNFNIMLRTLCLISTFAIFTNISAGFTPLVLAANSILLRFLSLAAYFIDGFAFALESLVGAFFGARDYESMRNSLRIALKSNIAIVVIFASFFYWQKDFFISLLSDHQEIVMFAGHYAHYICFILLASGFAYIFDGYFIGLARGKDLRNSMLIAMLIGFLPLALIAQSQKNLDLLWLAMLALMILRALTLWIYYSTSPESLHKNSYSS